MTEYDCNSFLQLGRSMRSSRRFGDALVHFKSAAAVDPGTPCILSDLAITLQALGQYTEAEALLRRLVQLDPGNASARYNLACARHEAGHLQGAIAGYRMAIALHPDHPNSHYNLANTLRQAGALTSAVQHYKTVLAIDPHRLDAHANLAGTYHTLGRWVQAEHAYRVVLARAPNDARIRYNLAQIMLLLGRVEDGFREYEWGWRVPGGGRGTLNRFPKPLWNGEAPEGQTILVWAEQGLGDSLHFLRYVPLLVATGARVVLEVQPEITTLAGSLPGVAQAVRRGGALPPFDLHVPLLSLPRILGTTLATIPAGAPYLHANADLAAGWERRLRDLAGDRLKVGLVWAGSPTHAGDRWRSIPFPTLAPLFGTPETRFLLLQKGAGRDALDGAALPAHVTDLGPEIGDFEDTAAIMANLDLVISADTAPAHLAGALGRPVWLLLPAVPDWRWMLERADSPWYPTMRLYRQARLGEWPSVVAAAAADLRALGPAR